MECRNLANRLLVLGINVPRSPDFCCITVRFHDGGRWVDQESDHIAVILHAGGLK